ncbi:hypothetical protein ACTFIY_008399 [Dictyostelium cf. discoideum]
MHIYHHLLKKRVNELFSKKALNYIRGLTGPIFLVSLSGVTRDGKSFIATKIARRFGVNLDEIFKDSNTLASCTIGIHQVAIPLPNNVGTLLIWDCEGTGSNNQRTSKMLALVTKLSTISKEKQFGDDVVEIIKKYLQPHYLNKIKTKEEYKSYVGKLKMMVIQKEHGNYEKAVGVKQNL